MNLSSDITFVDEKRPRRDSVTSDSSSVYETPVKPTINCKLYRTQDDLRSDPSGDASTVANQTRHTLPFHGKKGMLFPKSINVGHQHKESSEAEEKLDGLNLPPHMKEVDSEQNRKVPRFSLKLSKYFHKHQPEPDTDITHTTPDPSNEQIPVEVRVLDAAENGEKTERTAKDSKEQEGVRSRSARDTDREKAKGQSKISLRSIFGISDIGTKSPDEDLKEKQQKDAACEDTDPCIPKEDVPVNIGEIGVSPIQFPTSIPLRGRWGPKSRYSKALSAPEMPNTDNHDREFHVRTTNKEPREGILASRWGRNKKMRPVSFADEPTVYDLSSDTESADHGSADKSSVSKLTEEKQSKTFFGQLLNSIRMKNKDKAIDNEALRNLPMTIDKDLEQSLHKDQMNKDEMKNDGIVYAELDMARSQGHVLRRDDEKTEYAEIIHPKAADFKKHRDELKRSRENLSGSREHITEHDGTIINTNGKKEAAV